MTRDTRPKGGDEALRGDAGAMAVSYYFQTIMLELSIMRILLGGFSVRKLRMVGPGSFGLILEPGGLPVCLRRLP